MEVHYEQSLQEMCAMFVKCFHWILSEFTSPT
jgi:hypothetical protein